VIDFKGQGDLLSTRGIVRKAITLAVLAFVLASCNKANTAAESSAMTRTEEFNLRERCAKAAAELYKEKSLFETMRSLHSDVTESYLAHYNAKLNKCFLRVVTASIHEKGGYQLSISMTDVFEHDDAANLIDFFDAQNKEDHTLVPITCILGRGNCKSKAEFDAYTYPFMSE